MFAKHKAVFKAFKKAYKAKHIKRNTLKYSGLKFANMNIYIIFINENSYDIYTPKRKLCFCRLGIKG